MKKNIKLSQVKVTLISLLLFTLLSFFFGWYFGKNTLTHEEQNFDLSLMYDVKDILDDNFLDTRNEDEDEITQQDHI